MTGSTDKVLVTPNRALQRSFRDTLFFVATRHAGCHFSHSTFEDPETHRDQKGNNRWRRDSRLPPFDCKGCALEIPVSGQQIKFKASSKSRKRSASTNRVKLQASGSLEMAPWSSTENAGSQSPRCLRWLWASALCPLHTWVADARAVHTACSGAWNVS